MAFFSLDFPPILLWFFDFSQTEGICACNQRYAPLFMPSLYYMHSLTLLLLLAFIKYCRWIHIILCMLVHSNFFFFSVYCLARLLFAEQKMYSLFLLEIFSRKILCEHERITWIYSQFCRRLIASKYAHFYQWTQFFSHFWIYSCYQWCLIGIIEVDSYSNPNTTPFESLKRNFYFSWVSMLRYGVYSVILTCYAGRQQQKNWEKNQEFFVFVLSEHL